jgi:hypothetical protein
MPGVRLNLSGSGASISLGTRGFRHTIGPKGTRTTVGIPGTGLSWTEYKSHKNRLSNYQPESPRNSEPVLDSAPDSKLVDANVVPIESASAEKIAALSTSEFAPILNSVNQKVGYAPWIAVVCLVFIFLAFKSERELWLISSALNALIFIPAFISLDRYRRSIRIQYVLEGTAKTVAEALAETFREFKECKAIWQINAQGGTSDWKRNAGATTLAKRKKIALEFRKPACIRGDVVFPTVGLTDGSLYFLPDAVLVATKKSIAALPYQELTVSSRTVRFIEDESPPKDAVIVGHTWQFVNKKGGPDRRFNSNRQLPICNYGEIDFQSNGGLNYKIEYSRPSACYKFLRAISILHRPESLIKSKPITSFQTSKTWPAVFFWSCFIVALVSPLAVEIISAGRIDTFEKERSSISNLGKVAPIVEEAMSSGRKELATGSTSSQVVAMPLVITPELSPAESYNKMIPKRSVPLPRSRPFRSQ